MSRYIVFCLISAASLRKSACGGRDWSAINFSLLAGTRQAHVSQLQPHHRYLGSEELHLRHQRPRLFVAVPDV